MSTGPCMFGFRCPHHGLSEDADDLCMYPYTPETASEDMLFGFPDEMDCPLTELGSPLDLWILDMEEEQ